MTRSLAGAALLLSLAVSPAPAQEAQPPVNRDPERARFVTSDIDRFWRAYDLAQAEADSARKVATFQTEYLDGGSAGLADFVRMRIKSADQLLRATQQLPRYYASIRPSTLRVRQMEEPTRQSLRRFRELYPDATFPDVYFVVGIANTGGTASRNGLLIGTEMYGLSERTPHEELPDWMKRAVKPVERVPAIVAHEACHFNQKLPPAVTLLDKSIQEGSCDFIGELLAGETINSAQKEYGDRHEAELWREFRAEMDGSELKNWMYNGPTSLHRPADLGYYMGYKIAQWYHHNAADKRQAVRDILEITDYRDFLERSRYAGKFGG
jgi:hypothetical protein